MPTPRRGFPAFIAVLLASLAFAGTAVADAPDQTSGNGQSSNQLPPQSNGCNGVGNPHCTASDTGSTGDTTSVDNHGHGGDPADPGTDPVDPAPSTPAAGSRQVGAPQVITDPADQVDSPRGEQQVAGEDETGAPTVASSGETDGAAAAGDTPEVLGQRADGPGTRAHGSSATGPVATKTAAATTATTPAATAAGEQLPFTGINATLVASIGLLLILAGAAIRFVQSDRRALDN